MIHELKYIVGLPIPSLDREGRPLDGADIDRWTEMALTELTECFGGATRIAAPGTNVLEGEIVYEKEQILVVSACKNRDEFLVKRDRITAFAECMGEGLNQESVFVLAWPSDSCLIEINSVRGDDV